MSTRGPAWLVGAFLMLWAGADAAVAACVQIRTVPDLNRIRNNLDGDFCLAADLDLAGVANFVPIGFGGPDFFSGTFDGQGHTIRNLTISRGGPDAVGFFSLLASPGTISNLNLVDVDVRRPAVAGEEPTPFSSTVVIGALVGQIFAGATIENCRVSGSVAARVDAFRASAGGLVGHSNGSITGSVSSATVTSVSGPAGGIVGVSSGLISQSSATGAVTGVLGPLAFGEISGLGIAAAAGGLVGRNAGSASQVIASYATGTVTAAVEAGGLAGENSGTIAKSFAAGMVKGDFSHPTELPETAGGLVGSNVGLITDSYALGRVHSGDEVGGLIGDDGAFGSLSLARSFSAGRVTGTTDVGGLVGTEDGGNEQSSYWDRQTSGLAISDEGTGRTTSQLQASLPGGFQAAAWAITPGATYPYLKGGTGFQASLAAIVRGPDLFVLLPISQLDPAQYSPDLPAKGRTSLAAAYTTIARAIGATRDVVPLQKAKINQYWNDSTQAAVWQGPVTNHAQLGQLRPIAANQALGEANVVGQLKLDRPVVLRGTYNNGGGARTHWMLATAFTLNAGGAIAGVIADDPWTGKQVRINPGSKRVIAPANFQLTGFTVNGYQAVTFKPAPSP